MSPSPVVPTSVEFVKAGDIKVVAALGDSLTTGVGSNANNVLELGVEFRHLSWSIGGFGSFQDVITLANIIKLFNPNVIGASSDRTTYGQEEDPPFDKTGFNLATSGDNTNQLPGQTRRLIDTLKAHEHVNFKEDWKLLTILIGMNDICDYCQNKTLFSANNFIQYMTISLEMLMNEVPRIIVNVVQVLYMEPLREVTKPTATCQRQQAFCPCLVLPAEGSPELQEVVKLNLEFQKRLEELLSNDRFFKNDFAVVLQPFLKNASPARLSNGMIDFSFFTHDCFHFSVKGHEELAKGLWNNMFQPVGGKTMVDNFTYPITLMCPPSDHPYIFTRLNVSSSTQSGPCLLLMLLLSAGFGGLGLL
ncbi:hypothetical protein LDENG_00260730 [Lucifuga dentata]|nr:hypothetical protein LDENG_00260730 [Lucifuga dentata]